MYDEDDIPETDEEFENDIEHLFKPYKRPPPYKPED
jgi:hypothetical protein